MCYSVRGSTSGSRVLTTESIVTVRSPCNSRMAAGTPWRLIRARRPYRNGSTWMPSRQVSRRTPPWMGLLVLPRRGAEPSTDCAVGRDC
ncbi:Uncharacterised protein [Mycobacteroides abscessus subsp. abscessus]|nr:Uncharacterised protein [Mycobacteroides abscessus subsp. abscessus]